MFNALNINPFLLDHQRELGTLMGYMQVSLLRFKSYKDAVDQHVDYDCIMVNLVNPEPFLPSDPSRVASPDFSELQLMKEHKEKKKIIVFLDEKLNDDASENLIYCRSLREHFGVYAVISPFSCGDNYFAYSLCVDDTEKLSLHLCQHNQGLVNAINELFSTRPSQIEYDKNKRFHQYTLMDPPNMEGLYLTDLYCPKEALGKPRLPKKGKLEPRLEMSDENGKYPLKLIWETSEDHSSHFSYTKEGDTVGGKEVHIQAAEMVCRRYKTPSCKEINEQKKLRCPTIPMHKKYVGITLSHAARAYVLYLYSETLVKELKDFTVKANNTIKGVNAKIASIASLIERKEERPDNKECSTAALFTKIKDLKNLLNTNDKRFSKFDWARYRNALQKHIEETTPILAVVEKNAKLYDIDVMLSKVIELEAGNISHERLRHLFLFLSQEIVLSSDDASVEATKFVSEEIRNTAYNVAVVLSLVEEKKSEDGQKSQRAEKSGKVQKSQKASYDKLKPLSRVLVQKVFSPSELVDIAGTKSRKKK